MESSLKQRIYENILRFMENYRYIKSTAEATIPNFIFQKSPLLSLFYVARFWGYPPPFLTVRVRFSQLMAAPIEPINHPCAARFPTAEQRAGSCGVLLLGFGQRLAVFSRRSPSLVQHLAEYNPSFPWRMPFPHSFRFRFLPIVDSSPKQESNAILKLQHMKSLFSTALPLLNDQLAADAGFKFFAFDPFL